jgi:hypothetical protein
MKKGTFAIIVAVVLAVALFGNHAAGIIGLGILGAGYWLSLKVHPRTRHGRCGGTGEHRGAIGGRMIRAGAGTFGTGPVRDEYTRRRQARRAARDRGAWR